MDEKRIFMISVIDKEGSINRRYVDTILWILNNISDFNKKYIIQLHSGTNNMDLYQSLEEAIQSDIYAGYIVLLDCLDENKGCFNPNVMFEFGGIKNLNKPFVVIAIHKDVSKFPFDIKNVNIGFIPEIIKNYIIDVCQGKADSDIRLWFKKQLKDKEQTEILNFFPTNILNLKNNHCYIQKEKKKI